MSERPGLSGGENGMVSYWADSIQSYGNIPLTISSDSDDKLMDPRLIISLSK